MRKIACIGNAVYDITVSSNKPLVEGVRNSFSGAGFTAGGPASNAASVIARYGSPVDFYGRVGKDLNGQFVYNKMQSENINSEHLYVSDDVMTPFSFVILNTSADTRTICTVRYEIDYGTPKIGNVQYGTEYDYILTDGKYVEETIELNGETTKVINKEAYNHLTQILECTSTYISSNNEYKDSIKLRYTYPLELKRLLHQHGFELVNLYGSWKKAKFDANSTSMVVHAQLK